eukprot:COSAG06_NODE_73335_length_159_cov_42.716667_1_plen_36_part_01
MFWVWGGLVLVVSCTGGPARCAVAHYGERRMGRWEK